MIINQDKTELMLISKKKGNEPITLQCDTTKISSIGTMKVLGIMMDESLTWSPHISSVISKFSLTGGLKYLRRVLTEEQFLKVLTSQYYGICYYGSQVWLGNHTRKMDLKKVESIHYRLLRIAKRDYKNNIKRCELDNIGHATPQTWIHYCTSSLVVKILRDSKPKRLHQHLKTTLYTTRRDENTMKFFDASTNKKGYQAIGNRLTDTFNLIGTPILLTESDDQLQLKLKKCFNMKTKNTSTLVPDPKGKHNPDGPIRCNPDDGPGIAEMRCMSGETDEQQYQNP